MRRLHLRESSIVLLILSAGAFASEDEALKSAYCRAYNRWLHEYCAPGLEDITEGKILIGGTFTEVKGFSAAGLARLNADGTVDTTFGAGGRVIIERPEAD